MSLLTDFQNLNSNGVSASKDFGQWYQECNTAFQNNYPTDNDINVVISNARQVWPDLVKDNLFILMESLTTPKGDMAFKTDDIFVAISNSYGVPKINLDIFAKQKGDTPTAGPRWQNTDVFVEPGMTVTINYVSGTWTANPSTGMVDATGNSNFKAKAGYTLPGENEGALVGRIVNNSGPIAVFLVGKSKVVDPGLSGYLELGINDDLSGEFGEGFADNEGSIKVEILRSKVAEDVPISS